jgi:hypothetical protein
MSFQVGEEVMFLSKKTEVYGTIIGEDDLYYFIKSGFDRFTIPKELVIKKRK